MKKLIYLLPLLLLFTGCLKTANNYDSDPPALFGAFTGKFTRTHNPGGTGSSVTTANIQFTMASSGFTLISDDDLVHANGNGEFLGTESTIDFADRTYPATAPTTPAYLNGSYQYTFSGNDLRLRKVVGDDVFEYTLTKKP